MKNKKYTFPIEGLHCASCASNAEKVLQKTDGVIDASVNLSASTATIEFDSRKVTVDLLAHEIKNAGYTLLIESFSDQEMELKKKKEYAALKKETIQAVIISVPLFIIGMFCMTMPYAGAITAILSTILVFYFGRGFFSRAFLQLKNRNATMDTLVALSTTVAYLFSLSNLLFPKFWISKGILPHLYFEAAGMIIAFILLGRFFEERAKRNTASAIKSLIGLQPITALREIDGKVEEISASLITPNDVIVVRPGEKVAVDGDVIDGSSYVDESMLSGEAMPVQKEKGNKVYAGTINKDGSFRFVAKKVGSDTVLSHIISLVREAQNSKPPVQELVNKIASVFVPVIIFIAVISFIVWLSSERCCYVFQRGM